METQKQTLSERFYRGLLRLFPFDFRGDFGPEMEQAFREQRAHVQAGKIGLFRLWWETIAGIFTTAPAEHLSMLRQDVRYALRMMRKNLSYTAVAVLTLALGIGANTAIVSVINAVLLKPLPYQQGDQLVMLHQRADKLGLANIPYSVPEIQDYRQQNSTLSDLVEYHSMQFMLLSKDDASRVRAGVVSDGFFGTFGVKPILGRDFTPADDRQGAPAVLLLSYEYWKKHERGDPGIVGKTFQMNDREHTVIGVLPPVPQYPNENDVYMPTSACPFRSNPKTIANRNNRMMSLFGRMKPGVSVEHCKSDLALISSRMVQQHPDAYPKEAGVNTAPVSLRQELTKGATPMLLVLLGAAGCVLLIACANVANLTLARMAGRERELVLRSALGAGKGRLLRQLFTESLILGLVAAVLGVLFASQTLKLLVDFTARLTPRAREIQVDGYMLLFALAAALLTSIVAGSVSALYSRQDLAAGLKDGNMHSTAGEHRVHARDILVICQVAFSFLLLVGAGLMLRSFSKLRNVDPGFVPQRVLAMTVDLNWSKYMNKPELARRIANQLLDKIQSQPGVLAAAISSSYPMDPDNLGGWNRTMLVEGHPQREGQKPPLSSMRSVSPDYFKALGIPLIAGRVFTESDDDKVPEVVLINRTAARHYWRDEDPIGRRVSFDQGKHWVKVVGVVGDVKEFGLDQPPGDETYLAQAQTRAIGSIVVRTSQDGLNIANQMRRAILEVDPQTAIPNVETLEHARNASMASPRVMTDLLGIFAALALAIAAFGIGGILALTVNQRLNEIGIRIALGAKPGDLLAMILRQGMTLVGIGLAIGLASAMGLTRLMKTLLFEVQPTDPITFAGVSVVLGAAALLACYIPARRALRIDPLRALRSE
ncbi:MAG TPA: ABC transporter permease [Bryobacteraceae bacterium]|nr:ABC transporter permease [Bryobacteraceae bacterium]